MKLFGKIKKNFLQELVPDCSDFMASNIIVIRYQRFRHMRSFLKRKRRLRIFRSISETDMA